MNRFLILLAIIHFSYLGATSIECTTKFSRGENGSPTPTSELWCGPVSQNIANNGAKYRKDTSLCSKVKVEFFSIKATDDQRFVTNCEKIFRRDCYMVGIKDIASRGGMGNLQAHTVFENVESIPDTFNITAHAFSYSRSRVGTATRFWLDLNCRVRR
jgi:hypothetical protein